MFHRSESDMTSIDSTSGMLSARTAVGCAGNTKVQSRNTVRIPCARSITNLNQVGVTPSVNKSVLFFFLLDQFILRISCLRSSKIRSDFVVDTPSTYMKKLDPTTLCLLIFSDNTTGLPL